MSFPLPVIPHGMTETTQSTVNNLGVVMFTVADQDAALAFYPRSSSTSSTRSTRGPST
jgi:hypothetical protein